LTEDNLLSSEYKKKKDGSNKEVYAGDITRFISGDRKSLEIEKYMNDMNLKEDEVLYVGRGEAGIKTFSAVNSVAFNPSENIVQASRITIYGSSLISLLVLFNFDGKLDEFLLSREITEHLPSLLVISETKDKSEELLKIEMAHRKLQNNIIGLRLEHSADSYSSVEREIDVEFAGSSFNMNQVKKMVSERINKYKNDPGVLVKKIYDIARERYKNFHTA
jgi:hypothetical protein